MNNRALVKATLFFLYFTSNIESLPLILFNICRGLAFQGDRESLIRYYKHSCTRKYILSLVHSQILHTALEPFHELPLFCLAAALSLIYRYKDYKKENSLSRDGWRLLNGKGGTLSQLIIPFDFHLEVSTRCSTPQFPGSLSFTHCHSRRSFPHTCTSSFLSSPPTHTLSNTLKLPAILLQASSGEQAALFTESDSSAATYTTLLL